MHRKTIQINDLTIGYPGKIKRYIVAQHINASICSSQLTCLLGANGVGKSTLLRTLSAFQPKISGAIYLLGKEVNEYTHAELAKVISVVLTDKPDIYNMTVKEMVGLGRCPYTNFWGKLSVDDEKIVERALAQVKINHLSHRTIHTLSDGERQKTMIAKALAQDTPIIFLDEPTAFLDFPSKVEMMQLLHRLSRETDKTIFLSTHDVELALQIADNIWLMEKEKGVLIGTPEDLAIDGTLNRFFARKGIVFEESTGLFRVESECKYSVCVKGEGVSFAMVRKALKRNGISVDSDSMASVTIDIADNLYNVQSKNTTIATFDSIDALIAEVKQRLTEL